MVDDEMQRILQALKEAGTEDPDLSATYELHARLFQLLAQARAGISATLEMVDEAALQARLHQGLPLLSFAQVPLEDVLVRPEAPFRLVDRIESSPRRASGARQPCRMPGPGSPAVR